MERVYLTKKEFQKIVDDVFKGQTNFFIDSSKNLDEELKGRRVFEFMGLQYVEKLED